MQPISELDIITFGKYKGRTFGWLIDNAPTYILWLAGENSDDDPVIVALPQALIDAAYASDMEHSPPEEFYYQPD